MPTGGTSAHAAHFARQQRGEGTYVTAWQDGTPVGSGLITWAGQRDPEARAALPGCPDISNLGVRPSSRGRSVGTALVAAAESRIRERGYARASIGVGEDNSRAQQLYARLGYVDTGIRVVSRYDYPDADGVVREVVENDMVLVRPL